LGTGLIGYVFRLDQPASFAPGVTSKDLATELDAYADWKVTGNFTLSFVAAFAPPAGGRDARLQPDSDFTYGMVYVAFAY
jgi:hypothetical protein